MISPKHTVPKAVIWRLPCYYSCLRDLYQKEVERVSSEELAKLMVVTSSQVRLDLSYFGHFGQKGYGYNVRQLLISIGNILGIYEDNHIIVVGVGKLGRALLQSFPFLQLGFTVDAAFGTSPGIIGSSVSGIPIYHISGLEEYVTGQKIRIAALTLPTSEVQGIVKHLISYGITGFWNFTSMDLASDDPLVTIENVHFANSLLRLNYRMNHLQ